jgi:sortase A
VCVAAALAILTNIALFYARSNGVGDQLRGQEEATVRAARHDVGARPASAARVCANSPKGTGQLAGLVEAPSISLDAPVVEGTDDAQLAVAVGHVPASSWPGQIGTVVLAAHDVSWFSHIDHLGVGSDIDYVTPCLTYHYVVSGSEVVPTGTPVYNTTAQRLVLVTCYPLNALFLTPNRFLVEASLQSITTGGHQGTVPPPGQGSVPTSLPASVAAQVDPQVTTTAPLGLQSISGTPAAPWEESVNPINAEGSVLALYFGAIQVAETSPSEWSSVAPGVPAGAAAPLEGAQITGVPEPVTPTLAVAGYTLTGATIQATVEVSGGSNPGTYQVVMQATVQDARLVVTGWQMTPQ